MPSLGTFSVPNPKNGSQSNSGSLTLGQKSVLKAALCQKNQFKKPPNLFATDPFYKPPYLALLPAYPYPNQS